MAVVIVVTTALAMGAESLTLFIFFIYPLLYHDFEILDGGWSSSAEVLVHSMIVEAILKALDDVCF